MAQQETPLAVAVKGGIAGLIGTAAITVAMKAAPAIMDQLGIEQPGDGQESGEEPTEKLAEKVAEGVLETDLEEDAKQTAGQAIHWGYGAAWGVFYGIMQSSLHLPHWLHGTLFGGLVGVVASTLVPGIGLTPPPQDQPASKNAMQTGFHLLYGWVTALAFRKLSR